MNTGRTQGQNIFVGALPEQYAPFPQNHPLNHARQLSIITLCEDLGWLSTDDMLQPAPATEDLLLAFHTPDYVAALKRASDTGKASTTDRERFNFGSFENPIFPGLFERAAMTVQGSVLAAQQALSGKTAYHPAGGTHHGRPDRASGFCYFNDPVFAIQTLLNAGVGKVGYVDLDAHHGDGVQDAFTSNPAVACISVHQQGKWPDTGQLDDRGKNGWCRNAPVPRGFNDPELGVLLHDGIIPHLKRFGAEALVLTCGADSLAGDPLANMELSNSALCDAVLTLREQTGICVVLGGGGYNPWTTTRYWSLLWGRLNGFDVPPVLPSHSQALLRNFESDLVDEDDTDPAWLTSLADPRCDGQVRAEIHTIISNWKT